jgi:hypothetical protein
MKKILVYILFLPLLLNVFGVSQAFAQGGTVADPTKFYSADKAALKTQADEANTSASYLYNEVEGIYKNASQQDQAAVKPMLDKAASLKSEAASNYNLVINALNRNDLTLAQQKLEFLKQDADQITALKEQAIAAAHTSAPELDARYKADANKDLYACTSGVTGLTINIGNCVKRFAAWMGYYMLFIMSWLLAISGLFLNVAVEFGVVKMSYWVGQLKTINYGWTLVRDLGNLAFIFILLYVAVRTILGIEGTDTKRLIRNLIIIGLLVNFSLFFTKVLVDASNIVSIEFYKKIVGSTGKIEDFSIQFAKPLGITTLYKIDGGTYVDSTIGDTFMTITIRSLGGTVFLFITALTFLYAGFLFTIRFIVLIILMILSPIAYFGFILPRTQQYAMKWWTALSGQLFFAPLYMLLLFLVVIFASNMSNYFNTNLLSSITPSVTADKTGAVTSVASMGPMAAALNFFVIIGFLLASTIIATVVSASSGGMIGNIVKAGNSRFNSALRRSRSFGVSGTKRVVGGATAGTLGAIGRNTIGRGAQATLDSKVGDKLRIQAELGNDRAKTKLAALEKTATGSFDIRGANSKVASVLGGPGGQGGYRGKLAAKQTKIEAAIKRQGTVSQPTLELMSNTKDEISEAQKMYADAAIRGNQTDMDAANVKIKNAESRLVLHQANAKKEVRDAQLKYAAGVSYEGKGSVASTGGIGGLRMTGTKASRQAAKAFLNTHRTTRKPPEERLAEATAKVSEAIEAVNKAKNPATIKDLVDALGQIKDNQIKDVPSELLTNDLVVENMSPTIAEGLRTSGNLSSAQANKIGQVLRSRAATEPKIAQYFRNNKRAEDYW